MSKRTLPPASDAHSPLERPAAPTFGGSYGDLYTIAPNVPDESIENHIENRLYQLRGMLALTYGEGDELLQSLNDDLRQGFMWACAELLDEVMVLHKELLRRPPRSE
ncbi:hypothetical protein GCM10007933_35050 [Zoogloea oryzae]|uniref:Uncharacterized protein n=1 Tax=Zoogloea oryzae TaxID=310767 RepID=A0ABQ6FG92_9RHOO|nr:hypothetical protein [Zoogloea oryzae]GLT24034.1 hypothetical protein GCM10007933_35050 [Zoogloea oryzae]